MLYILHGNAQSQFHHWGTFSSESKAVDAALELLDTLLYESFEEPLLGISKCVVGSNVMDPVYVVARLDEEQFEIFDGYDIEDDYDKIMERVYEHAEWM